MAMAGYRLSLIWHLDYRFKTFRSYTIFRPRLRLCNDDWHIRLLDNVDYGNFGAHAVVVGTC